MTKISISSLSLFAVVLAALVGCGPGNLSSSLTGAVTIDGQPAPEGLSLQFQPTGPGASPSYARTDADGNYVAEFTATRKGILPGTHMIKLLPSEITRAMPKPGEKPAPTPFDKLPRNYYEQIGEVTITDGSNVFDIQLSTQGK
ncbi:MULTISPECIES: hypothetical protein [Bremerella]|uniref:hypothetical protein n=1 Tax=Bremerella TaxID=2714594 RepID=UPI0031F05158